MQGPAHTLPLLGSLGLQTTPAPPPPAPMPSLQPGKEMLIDLDFDAPPAASTGRDAPNFVNAVRSLVEDRFPKKDAPALTPMPKRSGLMPTMVDVTMHAPASTVQVDTDKTLDRLRGVAMKRPATIPSAPLAAFLVPKEGSDCYCMTATFALAAYDSMGVALSHDGMSIAPNWLAVALRMGGDMRGATPQARMRTLYGPVLNALAARLRNTLYALLSHENLGLCEIDARLDFGASTQAVDRIDDREDGAHAKMQDDVSRQMATFQYDAQPPAGDEYAEHASVKVTLRIDPFTSRMLRMRFAEYDRLKSEADVPSVADMDTRTGDAPILGSGSNDDPVPYGHEDLLWGQTISEMLWLAGAEMRPDVKRRDIVAFDQCLCDAELLKVPNAPPHFATAATPDADTGQPVVRWRMAVAPMVMAPC